MGDKWNGRDPWHLFFHIFDMSFPCLNYSNRTSLFFGRYFGRKQLKSGQTHRVSRKRQCMPLWQGNILLGISTWIDLPFFFGNSLFFNFALPHPQKVSCWWSPAALFLNMPQGSSRHDFICFLWVTKWQGKGLNRSWPLTADLNSFNLKM